MLLLINRERSKIIEPSTKRLLAFTVIVVSFANFVMPIPSLGKRFMILSYPLIAYLWLDVFGTHRYKNYLYMIPIVFFMSIYHLIEAYVQNVDVMFYISSPIIDLVRFLWCVIIAKTMFKRLVKGIVYFFCPILKKYHRFTGSLTTLGWKDLPLYILLWWGFCPNLIDEIAL